MDEIAIISDIHGNLEALNTVLNDIRKRNIKKIYCLGDTIGKGSNNKECYNLVRKNCEINIKGNWEEFILYEKDKVRSKYKHYYESLMDQLDKDILLDIKSLPMSREFYMSGRLVRLFHGGPGDTTLNTINVDTLRNYSELFKPSEYTEGLRLADIAIFGHMHTPFFKRVYHRTILNTGSVGNSFEIFSDEDLNGNSKNTTTADYLIIRGVLDSRDMNDPVSYEFVSLNYDVEKELLNSKDNVEYEKLEEELTKGKYREVEKYKDKLEEIKRK